MADQFNADTIEQMRRILTIFNTSESEIRPHFFLTGGSGTGKTHAAAPVFHRRWLVQARGQETSFQKTLKLNKDAA